MQLMAEILFYRMARRKGKNSYDCIGFHLPWGEKWFVRLHQDNEKENVISNWDKTKLGCL